MASRQPILGEKSAELAYSPSFVALAIRNGLEYHNADGRVNTGDDVATVCKNLVKFGPVTLEFTRLICVQQASISSAVSLVTFARRQHC